MPQDYSGPDSVRNLEELLCFAVYSANHAFNRVYKPLLDRLGLTYPQYLVLILLWEEDDRTVGSLGRKLFLESNTLTPLLKRMEGMGLVERRRDPEDERQVRIRLTGKGRALRDQAADIPRCILEASGMSIDALQGMKTEIDFLRDNLDAAIRQSGTGS
ncbi:MarR family transcriptional regulator [Rhodospirillaceae bacterium KN72]|uniref:MarR family transcriptional regulator n=1 Tax=Pacificispira spongiicola TaxID=2729598 RepID=A0A7Y0DX08_9PROT|nr:MarR family transcriptional regulator [Pacificispira spongiicola]NMM43157.1 MarR family transcriptional regulator [Pacificispira spongiicola]